MSKVIWIINHYAGNSEVGLEFRHFLLSKELQKQGYKVYIISSTYTHLLNEEICIDSEYQEKQYDNISYIWIKTPKYIGNGLSRFKNMFVFSYKLHKFYKKFNIEKPDYVITSAPHPFVVLNGYLISKHFKSKFIFEERDLWPMSIEKLIGLSKRHPLILLLQWLEDFAYKKADLIISPLVNLEKNIKNRKIEHKNFLFLPNGILEEDMKEFCNSSLNIDKYIKKHKLLVGFAGTIGASNCVNTLVESAQLLQKEDIGFIIIGDGEEYNELKKYTLEHNLKNVYMLGKQDKNTTIKILKECNVLYNAAPKNELYKYGLSAIKVPEYMYLEKYIINAVDIKNDIVEITGCGSTIEPENVQVLSDEILTLYCMDIDVLNSYGKKAKEYVLNNLTYKSLIEKFIKKIERL